MSTLFQQAYPDRYFEMGIAEQNMASTAAGLALTGKIAFISSFAVFASGRAYDQLRQTISIAKLNVKICGSSSGLSDFGDGSTHQAVEDVAIMRAIPNMTVLTPVDAIETRKMVKAMASHPGPVYLRVNRNDLPVYTSEDGDYQIGKLYTVKEGRDVVIFANGVMVSKAMEAARSLEEQGISAKVVNVSTVKPLDRQAVIDSSRGLQGCGRRRRAQRHRRTWWRDRRSAAGRDQPKVGIRRHPGQLRYVGIQLRGTVGALRTNVRGDRRRGETGAEMTAMRRMLRPAPGWGGSTAQPGNAWGINSYE